MKKSSKSTTSITASYWHVFRLIFVVFSLYLMGYSFYLWDGFREYGAFPEFLLSISLASVLWSITAVLTAFFLWLLLRLKRWTGLKNSIDYLILFSVVFIIIGYLAQTLKILIWSDSQATNLVKFVVFILVAVTSVLLARLFRNKIDRFVNIVQERITPLVWVFGVFVVLSLPLVTYYTWLKETDKEVFQTQAESIIADKNRPNIVLITYDALTARDMSVYGYSRDTTPFITKWAKNASLFTMAEAESDSTTPTTASLMTGKRVWSHKLYHIFGTINAETENMPLLLKEKGYYNIALVQNYLASVERFGISKSFDIAPLSVDFMEPQSIDGKFDKHLFKLFGHKFRIYNIFASQEFITKKILFMTRRQISRSEYRPEKVFDRFWEIIDSKPKTPFFAWLHVLPPHDPFIPPEPYMGMFNSSPKLRTFNLQGKTLTETRYCTEEEKVIYRARYNEFIRYCDKTFEDFIAQLSKRKELQNTVVILSADHGESFEHGVLTHGTGDLYEQLTNIPLIIKEPGQERGIVINNVVEQIDIPRTILALANIPAPSWIEGRSLIPLMRGQDLPSIPMYSMSMAGNRRHELMATAGTFTVWDGDYKLIHYLKDNKSLLFNIKKDPGELNSLVDQKTEITQRLLDYIMTNVKKANKLINAEKKVQ